MPSTINFPAIIAIYLVGINVLAFAAFGNDKWRSQHRKWRIPEATLLSLAAVGGSVGAWLGMQHFHHKTSKPKFRYGVPVILIFQVLIIVGVIALRNVS